MAENLNIEDGFGCINRKGATSYEVFTTRNEDVHKVERQRAVLVGDFVRLQGRFTGFGPQKDFLQRFASEEQTNTVLKRQNSLQNLRGSVPDMCLAFKLLK